MQKLIWLIKTQKKFRALKNHIIAFKPAMVFISRKSDIQINRGFLFNRQWDDKRIINNKIVGSLYVDDDAKLNIDKFSVYAGCKIVVNKGASLVMKSGYMNDDCCIDCYNRIEIGNDCVISKRCVIRDSNSHVINSSNYKISAPITIGDHVWIGIGVTILPGVTIGDGAVIGAGSLVNKDIPANSLAVGVPAKVVRENIVWR